MSDITITVGGKSTVAPAVDQSLAQLRRLDSGASKVLGSLKGQLKGLKQLGGLTIAGGMIRGLVGDLDEVSKRLGGQLGEDVAKLDADFARLKGSAQSLTDEIIGKLAPALSGVAKIWQGLADTMPRSGIGAAQGAFESKIAAGAAGLGGKSLDEQLAFQEQKGKEAGKLMADAVKELHRLGLGNRPDRQSGLQTKWDQLDSQRNTAEKAMRESKAAIDDLRVAMGILAKVTPRLTIAEQQRQKWGDNVPDLKIKAWDDPPAVFNMAPAIDEMHKEDQKRKDFAGRVKAALGPAPGLAPVEAGRLTRGRGVNVDPKDQAAYMKEQDKKAQKTQEEILAVLQKMANDKGRGVF